MRLHTRTTIGLVLPVLACLGLFGLFAYAQMHESMLDAKVEHLESVADVKVAQVERLIETYRHDARFSLGLLQDVYSLLGDEPNPEVVTAVLVRIREANEEVASVDVVLDDGFVFASTVPERVATRAAWELSPFDSASTIDSDVEIRSFVSNEVNAPRTVAMAPIVSRQGYRGRLVIRFRATSLDLAIENQRFSRTGELLLAYRDVVGNARFLTDVRDRPNARGTVLAAEGRMDVTMMQALGGQNRVWLDEMVDYAGNDAIGVSRYIPALDWGLVAIMSTEEFEAPLLALRNVLVALAIVLALILSIVGHYLGGKLAASGTRLEEELLLRSRAERRVREVLAGAPAPMVALRVDMETGIIGGVEIANRQAEILLGDEAKSDDWSIESWIHPESRAAFDSLKSEALAGTGGDDDRRHADIVLSRHDGTFTTVEVSMVRLEVDSGVLLLVTLVDLTERIAAKAALEAYASELERSNRDLDDFANVASHDLKAPLRAVIKLAAFIEEDAGEFLPEESLSDLRLLRGRAERLDNLLAGLLDYSRVGRIAVEAERIDPSETVEEVIELYVPSERFDFIVDGHLPPVYAPRAAFYLVLRNLVMNSVKHHDLPRGTLRLSAIEEGDLVRYRLEDDGPGVPAQYADRIFQLFETLRPRDEVEGSGLGLAMVKKTMESLGGSVELVARPGRGAAFDILWPGRPRRMQPLQSMDAA